ncbi:MAG TPA: ERAP1-like C-terminal domain-containing protein, partial [Candidatus Saccharimonadales bacterium]|nr:ERAP1-like C-terminal domain-containing protein [Candidatus Saccharimonadales bacterium]
ALLAEPTQSVQLHSPDYVRLNEGALGHYIVQYTEPAHAETVAKLAETKVLATPERLMLLSDSGMLARGGQQAFAATLELLKHYGHEDREAVWDILSLTLGDARRFIDCDSNLEDRIRAFVRTLIQEQYDRLGWDEKPGEELNDTKLRASILGLGVFARHEAIVKRALELFEAYKKDANAVPSELRGIVFAAAVRLQAAGAFEYLLNLYDTTQNSDLQQEAMGALTSAEDASEITQLVERLTDTTKVRQQDLGHWLAYLLRNRHARTQAWQWMQAQWDWIEKTFGEDKSYDYFPRYAASAFNTRPLLEEYKRFFEPKSNQQTLARNIAMGIEEIETRVAWLERDLQGVQSFFQQ